MMNVAKMGQALQWVFGEIADRVARETKFVQRESKLTGSKFLLSWVVGFVQHPTASLNILCQVAEDIGVRVTKQGMQKRLTQAAVKFMEDMFERVRAALQNRMSIPLALLTQFAAIQLDSTGIALPDNLADEFPAAGGDGPQAGLKLQTIWEFLRGNLSAVVRQTGRQPDQGFDGHLAHVVRGTLFLSDLGYFVLTSLRDIAQGGARLKPTPAAKGVLSALRNWPGWHGMSTSPTSRSPCSPCVRSSSSTFCGGRLR